MKIFIYMVFLAMVISPGIAQSVRESLPYPLSVSATYLFYLHGGVITVLGDNAINQSVPEWGPYEYSNILKELKELDFNVISERRFESIPDSVYSIKLANQIDSLLKGGIPASKILVIGASAGWHIVLNASALLRNKKIHYVLMGGCWPDTYKDYEHLKIYGRFLSIIESTDPHGTCASLFKNRKYLKDYTEIKLNTGLSHGFFYKARRAWIDPIISWYTNK